MTNAYKKLRQSFCLLSFSVLVTACSSGSAPESSIEIASKGLYSAAFSGDGQQNVVGSIYHGGSLWRTQTNERLYNWNHKQGDYSNIIASAFSPEGDFALTADHQTMVLWDARDGKALTFWTAPNEVLDIALSMNGNFALLGLGDNSAVLFDVKRGGIKRSFYHNNRVAAVALSTNGNLAITGDNDGVVKAWNVQTGKELYQWQHDDQIVTIAISPNGDKALTVAKYDRAIIWDTQTGKALKEFDLALSKVRRGQAFTSARFSSNSKQLLTGNSDRLIQLWDTSSLKELASWTVPKRSPWKPTSASILAVSFGAKSNEFYAISSNGFSHRLKRP